MIYGRRDDKGDWRGIYGKEELSQSPRDWVQVQSKHQREPATSQTLINPLGGGNLINYRLFHYLSRTCTARTVEMVLALVLPPRVSPSSRHGWDHHGWSFLRSLFLIKGMVPFKSGRSVGGWLQSSCKGMWDYLTIWQFNFSFNRGGSLRQFSQNQNKQNFNLEHLLNNSKFISTSILGSD